MDAFFDDGTSNIFFTLRRFDICVTKMHFNTRTRITSHTQRLVDMFKSLSERHHSDLHVKIRRCVILLTERETRE